MHERIWNVLVRVRVRVYLWTKDIICVFFLFRLLSIKSILRNIGQASQNANETSGYHSLKNYLVHFFDSLIFKRFLVHTDILYVDLKLEAILFFWLIESIIEQRKLVLWFWLPNTHTHTHILSRFLSVLLSNLLIFFTKKNKCIRTVTEQWSIAPTTVYCIRVCVYKQQVRWLYLLHTYGMLPWTGSHKN